MAEIPAAAVDRIVEIYRRQALEGAERGRRMAQMPGFENFGAIVADFYEECVEIIDEQGA